MKSFQLFKDKNAKDWRVSLKEIEEFFSKNKQQVLVFLLGFATFPILFFLTVSLTNATTGLISAAKGNVPTVKASFSASSVSAPGSVYLSWSATNATDLIASCYGPYIVDWVNVPLSNSKYGPIEFTAAHAGQTETCAFVAYNGALKGEAVYVTLKVGSTGSATQATSNSSARSDVSANSGVTETGASTTASTETVGSNSTTSSSSTSSGIDLSKVVWLHTNVSGWSQTASLSSVNVSSSSITLNYNKANSWPGVNGVNANPWVFVKQNGTWYAATWEWLRTGQTTKNRSSVNGDHIKVSPLKSWSPKAGETYGFMVSGLARDNTRNVQERSNIVMIKWPASGASASASSGSVSSTSSSTTTGSYTGSSSTSSNSTNSSTSSNSSSSSTSSNSSSGGYYCPSDCYLNSSLKWCYYKGNNSNCDAASTNSTIAKCTAAYTYCAGTSSCMRDNDYDMGMCPKTSGGTANGGSETGGYSSDQGSTFGDSDAAGAALDPSSMGDFGHVGDGTGTTSNTGRDAAGGLGIVCFPSGTRITLADGTTRNIENIGAGDLILSYNLKKQQLEPSLILSMRAPHLREGIYTITFSDSTKLKITDDHPLYVTNEKGWSAINPAKSQKSYSAKVGQIEIGDRILQESGKDLIIKSITYQDSSTMVYTIGKVSNNDNFFADGSLAHVSE